MYACMCIFLLDLPLATPKHCRDTSDITHVTLRNTILFKFSLPHWLKGSF